MQLPLLQQLQAIVVAPADPSLQVPPVMPDPALELAPDFVEGCGCVNIGLADMGQFAAKRGKLRASPWFDEALKMIDFPTLAIDQRRTDFDDFHIRNWPTTIIGGCFQVDHQPMPHSRLPCKTR
ncbi:hypothetical protein D3C72_1146880 [compost metagenome]